jgi:hypothetical protein
MTARWAAVLGAAAHPLPRAYCRSTEPSRLPVWELVMTDKSPRNNLSKKSGKSIKEKRAEKRGKVTEETFSDKIHPTKKK